MTHEKGLDEATGLIAIVTHTPRGGQANQYYAAKKGGTRNVANDERGVSCQIFVSDALNNSLASGYRKYNYISIQSVHAPVRRQQRDTAASERPLCFDVIRTSADSFLYISIRSSAKNQASAALGAIKLTTKYRAPAAANG